MAVACNIHRKCDIWLRRHQETEVFIMHFLCHCSSVIIAPFIVVTDDDLQTMKYITANIVKLAECPMQASNYRLFYCIFVCIDKAIK